MKWANTLRVFKKKFTESKPNLSQQCLLVLWYRWVPRTLTYQGSLHDKGPNP